MTRDRRPVGVVPSGSRSPASWRRAVTVSLLLLLPAEARAHGPPLAPHELWSAWTLDWWILASVFLPAGLYARGLRRLWQRAGAGRGVRRWQAWCFAAGIFALFVALISPLDALGGTLFSAHMLQHVVLMLVAAPLLVLAAPLLPMLWALPIGWRYALGRWARHPDVRGFWYVFSNPVSAWLLHAAALWVWHIPALYEATLYSELVHFAQHAAFAGTALLFWWAAFDFGRRRRLRHGIGTIYVFTTALQCPRRTADVFAGPVVSGVRGAGRGLGIEPARGSAARRSGDVGPGRHHLSGRLARAAGGGFGAR
jgi:putative membrane protein